MYETYLVPDETLIPGEWGGGKTGKRKKREFRTLKEKFSHPTVRSPNIGCYQGYELKADCSGRSNKYV